MIRGGLALRVNTAALEYRHSTKDRGPFFDRLRDYLDAEA